MLDRTPIAAGIRAGFPAVPSSSSVIDLIKAFWPLDCLIEDLYAGDIGFAGSTALMKDHDGSYGEIIPSLAGWTSTMERIGRALDTPIDLSLLNRIANRIEAGVPLDVSDIDKAAALVNRAKAIFMACPVHVRKAAVVVEFIDIEVSALGLREAA